MTIDAIRTPAVGAKNLQPAGDASAASTIKGLAPFAIDEYGKKVDLSRDFPVGGDSLPKAWALKDAGALEVWADTASTGKIFRWMLEWNTMAPSYFDRAVSINVDSSLWHQVLVKDGKIKPLNAEWRKAVEIASFILDLGDDGLGGDCYKQALGGAGVMSPSLTAKVAALSGRVGGSGGLYVENAFDATKAKAYMAKLATEAERQAPPSFPDKRGAFAAIVDKNAYQKTLADMKAGGGMDNAETREAYASALLIIKLADNSRGRAYDTVKHRGIAALSSDSRYRQVLPNFEAALKKHHG
ncbi:MAG: hypothetical protein HY903_14475 [Deltaproteobacteria bacterium]|nr:hypothetical protein [Deltaproteobacteria bacterium]